MCSAMDVSSCTHGNDFILSHCMCVTRLRAPYQQLSSSQAAWPARAGQRDALLAAATAVEASIATVRAEQRVDFEALLLAEQRLEEGLARSVTAMTATNEDAWRPHAPACPAHTKFVPARLWHAMNPSMCAATDVVRCTSGPIAG